MGGGYLIYMLMGGALSLIGAFVSKRLQSKFQHYSGVPLSNGMTGKEVAENMLAHYGIHDVKVVPHSGSLTDHYNPKTKTIALSEPVYNARTVAAAAVAAHECGHAVQHDTQYAWLQMRSAIVPVVQIASKAQQYLMMFALGAVGMMGAAGSWLLFAVVVAFGITALFSFITLPVEFDASKRALVYLDESGITGQDAEYDGAKDALHWAAMTYVAAALSALVYFLFFLLRFAASK